MTSWKRGTATWYLVFVGSCYMAAYIRGSYFKSEMLALGNNCLTYSEAGTCSIFSCKAYMSHMIFKELMLGIFLYYYINISCECKWDTYSKLRLNFLIFKNFNFGLTGFIYNLGIWGAGTRSQVQSSTQKDLGILLLLMILMRIISFVSF